MISILMVVFLVGILAGIAIPKLLDARHRAKARATTAKMRYLSNAVQAMMSSGVSTNQFPDNIDDLVRWLKQNGYESAEAEDAWGNKFEWDRNRFYFRSFGSDKKPTSCPKYTNHRCDIKVENGVFLSAPDIR